MKYGVLLPWYVQTQHQRNSQSNEFSQNWNWISGRRSSTWNIYFVCYSLSNLNSLAGPTNQSYHRYYNPKPNVHLKAEFLDLLFYFQVSWVRYRDTNLLAVGKYIYTRDDRFKVWKDRNRKWNRKLKFKYFRFFTRPTRPIGSSSSAPPATQTRASTSVKSARTSLKKFNSDFPLSVSKAWKYFMKRRLHDSWSYCVRVRLMCFQPWSSFCLKIACSRLATAELLGNTHNFWACLRSLVRK